MRIRFSRLETSFRGASTRFAVAVFYPLWMASTIVCAVAIRACA